MMFFIFLSLLLFLLGMLIIAVQGDANNEDSCCKKHSYMPIILLLVLAFFLIGNSYTGFFNEKSSPANQMTIYSTIKADSVSYLFNQTPSPQSASQDKSSIVQAIPENLPTLVIVTIILICIAFIALICFWVKRTGQRYNYKKHESDNKVRIKRIERNGKIMRSIINSNYNVEDHFLTKMYEGECDIESNSNEIGSIKKFIEKIANKAFEKLAKMKETISSEIENGQNRIIENINSSSNEIKSEQDNIKKDIIYKNKEIINGQGNIKETINNKANETSEELKTINEDIKKIKENKTTNINIKISYNLLTQIAKMIHDFFFSNKNNKQNEQQTNN